MNPVNIYSICIIRGCSQYTQHMFAFIHNMSPAFWVIKVSGWGWGVAPPRGSISPHKHSRHIKNSTKVTVVLGFNMHVFSQRQMVLFVPPSSSLSVSRPSTCHSFWWAVCCNLKVSTSGWMLYICKKKQTRDMFAVFEHRSHGGALLLAPVVALTFSVFDSCTTTANTIHPWSRVYIGLYTCDLQYKTQGTCVLL